MPRRQNPDSPQSQDALRLLRLARLALAGHGDDLDEAAWRQLFQDAERERLVALIWERWAATIRRHAPADVSSAWRARSIGIQVRCQAQFHLLLELLRELRRRGLSPVVVKGTPLSALLYGSLGLRPTGDIDLLVPASEREAAANAIASLGWSSVTGEPPDEETFQCVRDGQLHVLELHSSLVDDPLLAHLELPVHTRELTMENEAVPVLARSALLPYLATHFVKHDAPPLLWLLDFETLYQGSTPDELAAGEAAAAASGVGSHVRWVRELARHLERASDGSYDSALEIARSRRQTGDFQRVLRLARLAEGTRNRLLTLKGRILPPGAQRTSLRHFLRRAAGWVYRRSRWLTGSVSTTAAASRAALSVDERDFAVLLEEALGRGFAIWIRARGESMWPAIPSMAAVRIVPVQGQLSRGDVVLARLPHGNFVLHRVVRLSENRVQLKGDASARRDVTVSRDAVYGVCDEVDIDGMTWNVADRPRDSLEVLTSTLWARTRAALSTRAR